MFVRHAVTTSLAQLQSGVCVKEWASPEHVVIALMGADAEKNIPVAQAVPLAQVNGYMLLDKLGYPRLDVSQHESSWVETYGDTAVRRSRVVSSVGLSEVFKFKKYNAAYQWCVKSHVAQDIKSVVLVHQDDVSYDLDVMLNNRFDLPFSLTLENGVLVPLRPRAPGTVYATARNSRVRIKFDTGQSLNVPTDIPGLTHRLHHGERVNRHTLVYKIDANVISTELLTQICDSHGNRSSSLLGVTATTRMCPKCSQKLVLDNGIAMHHALDAELACQYCGAFTKPAVRCSSIRLGRPVFGNVRELPRGDKGTSQAGFIEDSPQIAQRLRELREGRFAKQEAAVVDVEVQFVE